MGKERTAPLWQQSHPGALTAYSEVQAVPQHSAPPEMMDALCFSEAQLSETVARALRVLLGSQSPLTHGQLRAAVLGSRGEQEDHNSKCMYELAILSLIEQGMLVRLGLGSCAVYMVPDAEYGRAEALAYSQFPAEAGDAQLLFTLQQLGTRAPCAVHPLRRLSHSPRSGASGGLTRVRMGGGIEKRSGAKRSYGSSDDISSQLQKKIRLGAGLAGAAPGAPSAGVSSHAAAAPMQLSP